MSDTQKPLVHEATTAVPATSAAQQSDNIAHAVAGAGGGLLSMALTYVFSPPDSSIAQLLRF